MDRYPPIAEHGLIGDLQTAALVTTDGTVDWWCCPRFDSPSVFASLLDHDNGGRFRIGPEGDDYVSRQLYFPDTAILITRFMTPDGVGEVIDFLPVDNPRQASDRHRLVRVVRCVRGEMQFVFECAPRFDYGRQTHDLELTEEGAVFRTPILQLTLHGAGHRAMERKGNDLHGALTVRAGQAGGLVLESAATGPPQRTDFHLGDAERNLTEGIGLAERHDHLGYLGYLTVELGELKLAISSRTQLDAALPSETREARSI